jgi:DNA-binding IclR family transcriptional regulator
MGPSLSSVQKALKILQTFAVDSPELNLTEISRRLNSHKSSVFRLLSTLAAEGFVEKNPLTHKYRIGLKFIEIAHRSLQSFDWVSEASPLMERLSREVGEIVHLSILDGAEVVYLEKRGEGQGQGLTVSTNKGGRDPAHSCAMGKVLLAGLPSEELAKALRSAPLIKRTPNTITEIAALQRELEKVRKRGVAMDQEESFPGIKCVAAPIQDRNGKTVAAISVTAPSQRMGQQRMKDIRRLVIDTAHLISERIGTRSPS